MDAKLRSSLCRFQNEQAYRFMQWIDDVQIDIQTEKWMDRQINGLTNGQPGKRIERQIYRRADRQKERWTY